MKQTTKHVITCFMAVFLCSMSTLAQTEDEQDTPVPMYPFDFMGNSKGIDVEEYLGINRSRNFGNTTPIQNVRCVKRCPSTSNTAIRQQRVKEARDANARLARQSWERMREAQAAAERRKREEKMRRWINYQRANQEWLNSLQPVADMARTAVYEYAERSLQREQDALDSGGSAVAAASSIDGNVSIGDGEVVTAYSQGNVDELQAILDDAERKVMAIDDLDILQELGNYGYSEEEPVIPEDIDQKYYLTIGGVPYVDEDGRYLTFNSEEEARQELASFMSEWEQRVDSYDVSGGLKGNVLEAGREDISKIAKIVPPKQTSVSGTDGGAKDTTVSAKSGTKQKSTPVKQEQDCEDEEY